jgi:hypothetical protein
MPFNSDYDVNKLQLDGIISSISGHIFLKLYKLVGMLGWIMDLIYVHCLNEALNFSIRSRS